MSEQQPSRFGRLKKLDISGTKVARYTFYQVEGEPWIDSCPALESNPRYYNALLARSRKNLRRLRSGNVNSAQLAENRNEDRALYPRHICKGWGQMVLQEDEQAEIKALLDDDGTEVQFSQASCADFLDQLPDWIFDEYRMWCADPNSFVEESAMGEDEKADLEKNS